MVQAATAALLTSGEVAGITGTQRHSLSALQWRYRGQGGVGKEVPCPRSHRQWFSRVGPECIHSGAALLGVVCRSGRPGNRQCPGTEGGEPGSEAASNLWLAFGRSVLGTVPSTLSKPTPLLKC